MKHTQTKFIIMFLAGILFSTFTVFAAQISVNTNFDDAVNYLQKIILTDIGGNTGVLLDGDGNSYFLGNLGVGTNSPISSALVVSGEVNFINGITTIEGQLEVDDKVTFGSGLEVDNNVNLHSNLIVDNEIHSDTICEADGTDCKNVVNILTMESDPDFSASAAHGITNADITDWNDDINTQLTEAQVDAYANNNNYLTSYTETDPQVGTLTDGKWCTSVGGKVTCNSTAPTDTDTHVTVVNGLTSTSTTSALSAYQGKVLKTAIDSKQTMAGACQEGSSIRVIANDGSVTCEADDVGLTTESDPKVGTISTNGKWCTTDGSKINCTSTAPTDTNTQLSETQVDSYVSDNGYLTSYSESDPQVRTLDNNKWCTSDGTYINCTSDEPSGSSVWNTGATSSINYTAGKVSIGTTDTTAMFNLSAGILRNSPMLNIEASSFDIFKIGSDGQVIISPNTIDFDDDTEDLLIVNGHVAAHNIAAREVESYGDVTVGDLLKLHDTNLGSNSCSTGGIVIYSDNELCFCNGTDYIKATDGSDCYTSGGGVTPVSA